jgi:hypothetical protein
MISFGLVCWCVIVAGTLYLKGTNVLLSSKVTEPISAEFILMVPLTTVFVILSNLLTKVV